MTQGTRKLSVWPLGSGEMEGLIRDHDWSATPLGPIDSWLWSLKGAVELILGSGFPMIVLWGPDLIQVYNHAYCGLMGERHPQALGQSARECWPELWHLNEPIYARILRGETLTFEDVPFQLNRHGRLEEAWFTRCHSPLRDGSGKIYGVLICAFETTERVRAADTRGLTEAKLLASEERLALAVEIGELGHWELDLQTMQFTSSEQCRRNFGREPQEPFTCEDLRHSIHSNDRRRHEYAIAAAIKRHSSFKVQYRVFTPARELRHIEVRGRFECGSGGEKLVGVSRNISAQKRLELSLRASEERQMFLLKLSDTLRAESEPDAVANLAVRLLAEELAADRCYVSHIDPLEDRADFPHGFCLPGASPLPTSVRISDFSVPLQRIFTRMAISNDARLEPGLTDRDRQTLAALGFGAFIAAPVRRGEGSPSWAMVAVCEHARHWTFEEVALVGEVAERTWAAIARAQAEQAVLASEEKYSRLFDAIDEGFCVIEFFDGPHGPLSDYIHVEANPAYAANAGIPDIVGQSVREMVPDEAEGWIEIYREVLVTGKPVRFERMLKATGRHLELAAFRVEPAERRQVAVLFKDISARKRAEAHRNLLIHELNHRVKNTLVTVQSLAMQSLHGASSAERGHAAFEARLLALAKAHDILTHAHWEFAELEKIVAGAIAPYSPSEHSARFKTKGENLRLQPRTGLALAMALHELATNAIKYGALCSKRGQVAIHWKCTAAAGNGEGLFQLRWEESGGPPVTAPTRRGFGSRLIEKGLAQDLGGAVKLRYEPSGLICEISAPLEQVLAKADNNLKEALGN